MFNKGDIVVGRKNNTYRWTGRGTANLVANVDVFGDVDLISLGHFDELEFMRGGDTFNVGQSRFYKSRLNPNKVEQLLNVLSHHVDEHEAVRIACDNLKDALEQFKIEAETTVEPTDEGDDDLTQRFKVPEIKLYDEEIIQEMIDKVDKKALLNMFKFHVDFSDAKANLDNVLRKWAINKSHLYKILGNELRIKSTAKVEVDNSILSSKIQELKKELPQYGQFLSCVDIDEFKENTMKYGNSFLSRIGGRKGMKITKLAHSAYECEALDIELSKITQEKECDMFYYISIDPMDILTMSMTNSGWRSCHSFYDGEYRTGSVVYLYDNASLVAFCSSKDEPIDIKIYDRYGECIQDTVNVINKNWRQMVAFDTDTLAQLYSRQYPSDSRFKSRAIRDLFSSQISSHFGCENMWMKKSTNSEMIQRSSLENLYYNDVRCYDHSIGSMLRLKSNADDSPVFCMGANNTGKFLLLGENTEYGEHALSPEEIR